MKQIKIESTLSVFDSLDDLSEDVQMLMHEAVKARNNAYAPYSNFHVGTALLLDNGEIITGSNQENASYPSGLCAERTAIFYAGAKYPKAKVLTMVITASAKSRETNNPIPPCGACRQSIAEYEVKQNAPIQIYFMGKVGKVAKSDSLKNLLPFIFDKDQL